MRRGIAVVSALAVALWLGHAAGQDSPQAELLAKTDEITKKVAKIRGLAAKRSIERGVMNKAQLTERLRKRIEEEYTADEIAAEALALKRFGLLAADADYLEIVTELLESQVAGFYDPFERRLYVASWATFGGDMLLAHEIDHALQDQHFGLAQFMRGQRDNADATIARQALIEGDGTALMFEFLLAGMGQSAPWGEAGMADQVVKTISRGDATMGAAPLVLRRGLLFPYARGLHFVAHFRKLHPWSRIDRIYKKPPLSTEHILHPELYESYERPVTVRARVPGTIKDYAMRFDNVTGEHGLAVLLEAHGVDRSRAADAAAGWGGDRAAVFAPPSWNGKLAGTIGIVHTVWDTEVDALEFFEALSHALPSLAGGGQLVAGTAPTLLRYLDPSGAVTTAARDGLTVVLVVGAPPAREPDLRRGFAR